MNHTLKKIKIEFTDAATAFEFNSADGHLLDFNDLPRAEQIMVLNALAQAHHKFKAAMKP